MRLTINPKHSPQDNTFTCNACNRRCSSKGNLKRHLLTHTDVKPYSCDHCDKTFRDVSNLRRHSRTHEDVKPFSCETCGRGFVQKISLQMHCFTHTNRKDKRFVYSLGIWFVFVFVRALIQNNYSKGKQKILSLRYAQKNNYKINIKRSWNHLTHTDRKMKDARFEWPSIKMFCSGL